MKVGQLFFQVCQLFFEVLVGQLFNCFSRLAELHLRQNLLTTLPWEIGGLGELTFLDLGQNKFKELPGVIGTQLPCFTGTKLLA